MRLREYSDTIPKPLVPVGPRPMLWNLMQYYAHFGHREFVLCLGYRGEAIKQYFLEYDECMGNDFVMSGGGRRIELVKRDIEDWEISFVDTGLRSNIGQRLRAVRSRIGDDEVFLANYADGLSDLPLDRYVAEFLKTDKVGCFVSVKPHHVFHVVDSSSDGVVTDIRDLSDSGIRMNGGFFVFRRTIFDYIRDGEELVHEPFQRLIAERKLVAYHYDGFWRCMDTFKDRQALEDLCASGDAPWEVWKAPKE